MKAATLAGSVLLVSLIASAMIFTPAYADIWNGPLTSRFLSAKALTSAALAGSAEKLAGSVTSIPSEAAPPIDVTSLLPTPSGPMKVAFTLCSRAWRSSSPISGW
ncbi:hypothetical protein D3C87_1754880 [compost metagenome]